jgi:hypothetical protein
VIPAIIDTGEGDALVPAWMIDTGYAPCPHDGKPARAMPLHATGWLGLAGESSSPGARRPACLHRGRGSSSGAGCLPFGLVRLVSLGRPVSRRAAVRALPG